MHRRAGARVRALAALLIVAVLPACSVALHGHQAAGRGTITTAASGSAGMHSGAGNHAVAASFGRTVAPTAPGGHVAVSSGTGAAVLLIGIVVINAIDYLSGGWASAASSGAAATRPIAHTCSCYGYRPHDAQPPRE